MGWSSFADIAGVLAVAAAVAAVGLKLRQPLVISFLLAGILVGPSVSGLISEAHEIELLASIGISLLLFVVGLQLDVTLIRTVGPVALATGLGQVVFTSLIGFGIARAFGMATMTAAYVAVALTFSSTIIIVKLLSDKKEIDSLHGRIAVWFLIVQDIVAILALVGLTAFGGVGQDQSFLAESLKVLGKGLGMLGGIVVLMRWVIPYVMRYIAKSQELLVLSAIAWAIALASGAEFLGFSKEVGAFLAGISLASTPQRDSIAARLVVLRDFLLLFFFINLGAQLDLSGFGSQLGRASVFSVFVLIGNPIIVMIIMGVMGYRKRTGFMSGLAVAQISEFSLILAALGLSLGHIDRHAMSLITLVGLVTICVSTYMILYSGTIYSRLSEMLRIFERANPYRESQTVDASAVPTHHLAVMMGLGNYGSAIAARLKHRGWDVLAVDFDPKALARGRELGFQVIYADVGDPEMLDQLPLSRARWVICAIGQRDINVLLFRMLHEAGYSGSIALSSGSPWHSRQYHRLGADVVLEPFNDAAEQAVETITGAVQVLPGLEDWPGVVEEVSLQTGSVFTGRTLRELNLRGDLGASVLAVSRAGTIHFNPSPDLKIYPGDRMVLLCPPERAALAIEHLRQRQVGSPRDQADSFDVEQMHVPPDSEWVGKSLVDLDLRNRYGVTAIGIRRGPQRISSPHASEVIEPDDCLIVVGHSGGLTKAKASCGGFTGPEASAVR